MMFNLFRDGLRPEFFGAMWFMMILKVLWAVAVIWFVVWVVRSLIKANKVTALKEGKVIDVQANESALRIVKERYAKGEITKEQYDAYLTDLK